MAASSTSLSLSLDTTVQPLLLHSHHHLPSPSFRSSLPKSSHPFLSLKAQLFKFKFFHPSSPPPATAASFLNTPPRTGPFLDSDGLEKLQILDKFLYTHEFDHGSIEIRPMEMEELETTVGLLAESFIESMWMPSRYVTLLAFLVKNYLSERLILKPHMTTLVGIYKEKNGGEEQLACTAEISFDVLGANAAPPTPVYPNDSPYICNMTVKKEFRRRGIGWHLLKACEDLILRMKTKGEVYLHCRVVDTGPFSMYKKAGYRIVKTDSILTWLTLQRRKHLMSKQLPTILDVQSDTSDVDDTI